MASAESAALEDQKRSLRRVMSAERSRLPVHAQQQAASHVAALLAGLPELRAAAASGGYVAGFAATRAEIDPAPALETASRGGARLAWPRVASAADDGIGGGAANGSVDGDLARGDREVHGDVQVKPRLRFHLADRGDLRPGRFGIWEPDPSCPEVAAGEVEVMLVPGLAFDDHGNRLGFGGGYYDEVLAGKGGGRPGFVVGVGYDFQVVDNVPADARDARVDCLVTDARVIRCHGGAAVFPEGAGIQGLIDGARPRRRKVDP
ncbi:MAG: 5-formyltetrahydrofolate cyclo-ligase [Myxococcales bacterium]